MLVADNLIHASYTRALTRQVTGIELDEARSAGTGNVSTDIRIAGNLILGLLLDPSVYLETSLRGGKPLDDETDGINISHKASMPTLHVDDNVIADVGQGIDIFANDSHYAGDVIVRTPEFGLKVGHGASRNQFDGFRIVASGIAAVVIYGTPDEPVSGNRISNISIDHPGAVIGLPGRPSTAIELSIRTATSAPKSAVSNSGNVFDHVRITGLPPDRTPGWQGIGGCAWPAGERAPGVTPTIFADVTPAAKLRTDNGCGVVR